MLIIYYRHFEVHIKFISLCENLISEIKSSQHIYYVIILNSLVKMKSQVQGAYYLKRALTIRPRIGYMENQL